MKHSYIIFILPLLLMCLNACKTDSVAPKTKVTLSGKWYFLKHTIKLVGNNTQINALSKTNYTKDDFIQYFDDGSGLISTRPDTISSISLVKFAYSVNGAVIVQTNDGNSVAETITKLTDTEFSIHYETIITDPKNPDQTDNEIDDFYFVR